MDTEQEIKFLLQSQKSLGENIEKLYETVKEQSYEMRRFRKVMHSAFNTWLEDEEEQ